MLIFPSAVKNGRVGNVDNYNFTYNSTKPSQIGILKGIKGDESTLFVITENGFIYSFIITYTEILKDSELSHFIKESDAKGNINSEVTNQIEPIKKVIEISNTKETIDSTATIVENVIDNDYYEKTDVFKGDTKTNIVNKNKLYYTNKKEYFRKTSNHLVNQDPFFGRYFSKNDKILLQLNNVVFANNEIYLVLELKNNGIMDYDINFIDFYVTTKNRNKRISVQEINHEPVYTFNVPKTVRSYKSARFVLVYDKFSVPNKKVAIVDVKEVKGGRNLKLQIDQRDINNANIN